MFAGQRITTKDLKPHVHTSRQQKAYNAAHVMSLDEASKFGPYEILALLHSDDRGRVYKARDNRLSRVVAIKLLPVPIAREPEVLQDFEREARAISALNHPNICRLYDVGCHDGVDYLVMEYLEGENLVERLTRGPLSIPEALKSAMEICSALESAHNQGVFHRDLRTSTIFLTRTGAKLLDFGLAKIARGVARSEMRIVGGPLAYFAPEQLSGTLKPSVDACCNIFTFGAILYETVTGAPPFTGVNVSSFILSIVGQEPVLPVSLNSKIPDDLQRIVFKCLEKDRRKRYQNATEVLNDLQREMIRLDPTASFELRSMAEDHASTTTSRHKIISVPSAPVSTDPEPTVSMLPTMTDAPNSRPLQRRVESWRRRILKPMLRFFAINPPRDYKPQKQETLAPGSQIGPYEITSLLGAGGMGEVYSARDSRVGRTVAIKVLHSSLTKDQSARARFEREARAVSALNHPNICKLYDIGHEAGIDYLVMECLQGETLAARLKRGALPLSEVLRYGIQLSEALNEAHQRGIIHRDLKPANIFLVSSGEFKILDFGLAKLSAAMTADAATASTNEALTVWGVAIGSAPYMSPEQARGEDIDCRTDIFSMGATLFEMATGQMAFGGKTLALVFKAILDKSVPSLREANPSLPQSLEEIIDKALRKERKHRYQSAAEMRQALIDMKNNEAGLRA